MARYPVLPKGWGVFYGTGVDVLFILATLFLCNFNRKKLTFKSYPGLVNLLAIGSLVLVAMAINNLITVPLLDILAGDAPEPVSKRLMPSALDKENESVALVDLLKTYWSAVIYAPIVEEIIFRALFIGVFLRKKLNLWYLIATSVLAFIYVHNPIWNLWDLPVQEHLFMIEKFLVITCTLTYVFLRFGLIASIYIHFLMNLMLELASDGLELYVAGIMFITVLSAAYKLKKILFSRFRNAI